MVSSLASLALVLGLWPSQADLHSTTVVRSRLPELEEFAARLAELPASASDAGAEFLRAYRPAAESAALAWPVAHGWVAWGIEIGARPGRRLRVGLRELRADAFHAQAALQSSTSVQRLVVLLRAQAWDSFAVLQGCGRDWRVLCDEALAPELGFSGLDAADHALLLQAGWASTPKGPLLPFPNQPSLSDLSLRSANGAGTGELAEVLDWDRQGMMHMISLPPHEDWFDRHVLEEWPQPVWALSIESRECWPAAEVGAGDVWDLAAILEHTSLPFGLDPGAIAWAARAPSEVYARDWPREHGWCACALRLAAPADRSLALALTDERHDRRLVQSDVEPGHSRDLVLLVQTPGLERASLFCRAGGRWEVLVRELDPAAGAGGFGSRSLPELARGGWIERGVDPLVRYASSAPLPSQHLLALWSGNGPGSTELAHVRIAARTRRPSGVSLVSEPTEADPQLRRTPLADWPWPVWSIQLELHAR